MKSTNILFVLSFLVLAISAGGLGDIGTSLTESFTRMAHIAQEVEQQVHSQLKMTTRELTLNLSGITFPGPAKQGDNLNLSGLHIPGSIKCGDGYILKGNTCELGDLLLMQDLDAQNLIIGSLNLEELKKKQQEYIQNNPNFNPLKCAGEKPYLSKRGCISCADPYPYFNLESFKCSKCPDGSTYSAEIKNCQKGGSSFLSNLENKNYLVLSEKPLSKYREQYKQQKEQNSELETCPEDKPFSVGGECITCPEDTPLFFLPARTCTKCREGSTFDAETNLCIAEGGSTTGEPEKDDDGDDDDKGKGKGNGTKVIDEKNTTQTEEQDTDESSGGERWTVEKGLANIFGWNRDDSSDVIDKAKDIQNSNAGSSSGSNSQSSRTVTTTRTTTRTTNRSIRKQTDSEDQPQQSSSSNNASNAASSESNSDSSNNAGSESSTTTTVKNVAVEPIEEKPTESSESTESKESTNTETENKTETEAKNE